MGKAEWVEIAEQGWSYLAGQDKNKIIRAVNNFLPSGQRKSVFGKGDAGQKIVKQIEEFLKDKK